MNVKYISVSSYEKITLMQSLQSYWIKIIVFVTAVTICINNSYNNSLYRLDFLIKGQKKKKNLKCISVM